ncbi:MAG TPA: class I SAM-dependent methyltransferase [Anaerolineales bacterium]|jgi:magnesium-protoporphyrin O-methyltransferase|nr:class I SAM-dependent methyltransferase [Anaerolineales bacterium]
MPCNCCEITDNAFGEEDAQSDIKEYHKHGPAEQTRMILDAIHSLGLKDATLLDIGGGIGAIHHELLEDTAREATHVDASSAYLKEAKEEAARRGHSERIKFIHADFTDAASELPQADIVTLDRVVCCYPDFRGLLKAAAGHSRRALAMTYPRETWYMRIAFKATSFFQRLGRDPFRVFLHPIAEMDALLRSEGLQRVSMHRLFFWEMALYQRVNG